MAVLRKLLIRKLEKIPGVEDRPSAVSGGSSIFYNDKEVGHFHNNSLLDFRLGKSLIKKHKLIHPQIGHPERKASSQWYEYVFETKEDVEKFVLIFQEWVEQS